MTGILHDSENIAMEATKFRAHFAMLALRDMANRATAHAAELKALGEKEYSEALTAHAAIYREGERRAALAAGISNE